MVYNPYDDENYKLGGLKKDSLLDKAAETLGRAAVLPTQVAGTVINATPVVQGLKALAPAVDRLASDAAANTEALNRPNVDTALAGAKLRTDISTGAFPKNPEFSPIVRPTYAALPAASAGLEARNPLFDKMQAGTSGVSNLGANKIFGENSSTGSSGTRDVAQQAEPSTVRTFTNQGVQQRIPVEVDPGYTPAKSTKPRLQTTDGGLEISNSSWGPQGTNEFVRSSNAIHKDVVEQAQARAAEAARIAALGPQMPDTSGMTINRANSVLDGYKTQVAAFNARQGLEATKDQNTAEADYKKGLVRNADARTAVDQQQLTQQGEQFNATNSLAKEKQGIDSNKANVEAKAIARFQSAIDPDEKARALDDLQALQGLVKPVHEKYQIVPGTPSVFPGGPSTPTQAWSTVTGDPKQPAQVAPTQAQYTAMKAKYKDNPEVLAQVEAEWKKFNKGE